MTTLTNGDGTVSIHASAREATGFRVNLDAQEVVSIHASAREATIHAHAIAGNRISFNPRLREGGDGGYRQGGGEGIVSIHASAREATCLTGTRDGWVYVSIHASAREATLGAKTYRHHAIVSIHASAREATPDHRIDPTHNASFNPRLREGGDWRSHIYCSRAQVSIHASAREATSFVTDPVNHPAVSIHASAREATVLVVQGKSLRKGFNPRLREGGDFMSR